MRRVKKCMYRVWQMCFLVAAAAAMLSFTGVDAKAEEAGQVKIYNIEQTSAATDSATISWSAENASCYVISIMDASGWRYRDVGKTTQTSFRLNGLSPATAYDVIVSGYSFDEKEYRGYPKRVITLPDELPIDKDEKFFNLLESFEKASNVVLEAYIGESLFQEASSSMDGIECEFRDYDGNLMSREVFDKSTGNVSNGAEIEGKLGQYYSFKARGYVNFGGQCHYTSWIEREYLSQANVKSVVRTGKKLKIKWDKIKGVSSYDIYVSTNPGKGYRKVKTVGNNTASVTLAKTGKKKITSKAYYVYVTSNINDKKLSSEPVFYWSSKDKGKIRQSF